jgi:hypothetical protein
VSSTDRATAPTPLDYADQSVALAERLEGELRTAEANELARALRAYARRFRGWTQHPPDDATRGPEIAEAIALCRRGFALLAAWPRRSER